jgi:hypothetical protein
MEMAKFAYKQNIEKNKNISVFYIVSYLLLQLNVGFDDFHKNLKKIGN